MKRVVVIGGGNLAESLIRAIIDSKEIIIRQIYLRNRERAAELEGLFDIHTTTNPEELAVADIYILAVSDSAIAELSESLPFAKGAIVAHTAGSTPLTTISDNLRRGVFYPMQTFTKGRKVDFKKIPLFVEADDEETKQTLFELGRLISDNVTELDSERRRKLHLSAVFVCNFVNAMYGASAELVAEAGLPFDTLKALIEETCAKACATDNPVKVQTGPAVRGDKATQQRHIELLSENNNLQNIYQTLSKYIWETSKKI